MSRRSRKSKRRLNSLFMVILLTGMLLLSSTYAWFSANKEVALTGIVAKVAAAEGLQISLDGETWSSTITLDKAALEAVSAKNNYAWPDQLKPVSTIGEATSGSMNMFAGEVSADGKKLTNAAAEADSGKKYIVFDLFFKNSSSQTDGDKLQLNTTTSVQVGQGEGDAKGVDGTGLENSVRAAVVLWGGSAVMTADGDTVRKISAGTTQTSIWEPNYNKHITEVVTNDARLAKNASSEFTTLGLKSAGGGTIENINASTAPEGEDAALAAQTTVRTAGTVDDVTDMTDTAGKQLMLKQNAIMKARVYIWLEGQDPDCIDTASTGKALDIVLGFTKPGVEVQQGGGQDDSGEETP